MKYETTWHDHVRHLSNLVFICSYLCLERGFVIQGATLTIVGETLLAPSAIKQRSWSTVLVGGVFLVLALGTVTRLLLA
jgi:hypothetical protein